MFTLASHVSISFTRLQNHLVFALANSSMATTAIACNHENVANGNCFCIVYINDNLCNFFKLIWKFFEKKKKQ